MENTDIIAFGTLMQGLGETFPDRQLTNKGIDLYFKALADFPLESISQAMNRYAMEGKFFPKPAEIRDLVLGSKDERSQQCWNLLQEAFKKAGEDKSVCFQDPSLAFAVEKTFITWAICANELHTLSPEMLAFKKKEFSKNYNLYFIVKPDNQNLYFTGASEANNRANAGKWSPRVYEISGYVVLVGRYETKELPARFDSVTGLLVESSSLQIRSFQNGQLQLSDIRYKLLPESEKPKQLGTGKMIQEDEGIDW